MSKSIKVADRVYDQLEQIRNKRETFSEVVAKLLTLKEGLDTLIGVMYGHKPESERSPEFKGG